MFTYVDFRESTKLNFLQENFVAGEIIALFLAVEDLICVKRLISHVHISTILQVIY